MDQSQPNPTIRADAPLCRCAHCPKISTCRGGISGVHDVRSRLPSPPLIRGFLSLLSGSETQRVCSTVTVARMSHRKWRETKQQPSRDRSGQQLLRLPPFPVRHPGDDLCTAPLFPPLSHRRMPPVNILGALGCGAAA